MDEKKQYPEVPPSDKGAPDGSIRIKSALRIRVNDEGGEIFLPVEDTQFIEDFYNVLDAFSQADRNIKERTAGQEGAGVLKPVKEEIKTMMDELDSLFGEGCCRKLFGDIIPTPYAMASFFDQLVPIINKYADDRQAKIAEKYSRNREERRRRQKKRKMQYGR